MRAVLAIGFLLIAGCRDAAPVPSPPDGITDRERTPTPYRETRQPATEAPDTGQQADGFSGSPSISADGHWVAFQSSASNLVANDTNGVEDVFVHDRQSGSTERVSLAIDGSPANGPSAAPRLSAQGRWVAYVSQANNMVPGDTNGHSDVFVRDRLTGQTERVSVSSDGAQADGESYAPDISPDGRWVAFVSSATSLAPADTNGQPDVFLHDRRTRATEQVSLAGDGWSDWPSVSADGRFVAFGSSATNLTAEARAGVFVHDRRARTTEWIGSGFSPALSGDGRWVAFLGEYDSGEGIAVFLHDRRTGTRTRLGRVTEAIHGKPGREIAVSADGAWVAYWAGSSGAQADVFVFDRQANRATPVRAASGAPADGGSGHPSVSADGRLVAFESNATNLVPGDTNGNTDVFVYDRSTGQTERVSVGQAG